jgi:ribulose-5-phosphate 4-epimerase/fuculose-1-phosphate aldolase
LTEPSLTAQETKDQVLWAAKEMLRSGLVEGTAGNIGARLLGEIVPIPDGVNEQFRGYYRYGRTGKF